MKKNRKMWQEIKNAKYLYLMIIPVLVFYVVFMYLPMYGVQIAFKDYYPHKGIMGSAFNGFDNFKFIFMEDGFWKAFQNTLYISSMKIVLGFLSALTLAILVNELRMKTSKKVAQTIMTFPHFLSWVIIAGFVRNMFMVSGSINNLIYAICGTKVNFLSNKLFFMNLVFISEIWKEAGWGSIIYLATMNGIDGEIYEAASIDGSGRLRNIFAITIPSIKSTIILMLIMSVGSIVGGGFDQIFNIYNPMVVDVADILDTYIYRITFGSAAVANPGIPAAVGLFKQVIACTLVLLADRIAKWCGESGII